MATEQADAKKTSSFRLSEEGKWLLQEMARKDIRSQASMLEVLIREGARTRGIVAPAALTAEGER